MKTNGLRKIISVLVLLIMSLTACVSGPGHVMFWGMDTEWQEVVSVECTFQIERVWVCDEYMTQEGTVLTAGEGKVLYVVYCDYTFPLGCRQMNAILETGYGRQIEKKTHETVHVELSSDETEESDHVLFIFEYEPHEKRADYLTIHVESGEREFEIKFAIETERVSGLS